jgi:4a-hydroxytetrahydrobiopterin dehydratase
MPKLTEQAITVALAELAGWQLDNGMLVHDYQFPDFVAAMNFVNHVADMAEAANHHPDIDIRYNQVRLGLISHDSGGITNRDVRLATSINARFPL